MDVLKQLESLKIIPVVTINDAKHASALADALVAGGLPVAEITFRTAAAPDSIKTLANRSDILVGAGTVLSIDQAKCATDCGAKFLVSPGTNPKVVEWCIANRVTITPGVATPTDIELAMSLGLTVLKFFPADALGGLKTLKAISAPYNMLRFIPTGGITPDNLPDYLRFAPVLAVGGSWMVKSDLISTAKFTQITDLTRQAVQIAAQARP